MWEAFARQADSNTAGPTFLSCAHETLAVNLAMGYSLYTQRLQAVMLHTGVGLLQGSMGIDAANRTNIPLLIVSGEAHLYSGLRIPLLNCASPGGEDAFIGRRR